MSTVALRRGVLDCLALAGGWVPRADLDGLTTCATALDDVLADLVVQNQVVFKLGIGYRLAGDPLVRGAMRSMARGGQNRAVMGMQQKVPEGAQLRLGVAQRAQRPLVGAVAHAGGHHQLVLVGRADDGERMARILRIGGHARQRQDQVDRLPGPEVEAGRLVEVKGLRAFGHRLAALQCGVVDRHGENS